MERFEPFLTNLLFVLALFAIAAFGYSLLRAF